MFFVLAATMRQYFSAEKTMIVSSEQQIKFNNWCDFSLTKNVQTNGTLDINSDFIKGVQSEYMQHMKSVWLQLFIAWSKS